MIIKGDIVRISDYGNTYPSYKLLFAHYQFNDVEYNSLEKYDISYADKHLLWKVFGTDWNRSSNDSRPIIAVQLIDKPYVQLAILEHGVDFICRLDLNKINVL